MFSKIIFVVSSLFAHNTVDHVPVQERVITVSVPEDEIIIENIRPDMASMYF
jgi:hypothetical protein